MFIKTKIRRGLLHLVLIISLVYFFIGHFQKTTTKTRHLITKPIHLDRMHQSNKSDHDFDVKAYLALHSDVINDPRWHGWPLHLDGISRDHTQDIKDLTTTGSINISALASVPINDVMEEWEWRLLRAPPLTDALTAGNHSMSQLVELQPRALYRVGESVRVRVDVRDGRGRQLSRGGDDVRVFMQDPGRGAYLGMEVNDLGNGSYTATVPLLWSGTPVIKAALKYNAEFIRAFYRVQNVVKDKWTYMGGFRRGKWSEARLCSHLPLPIYNKQLCDFSKHNGGVAWYCEHPQRHNLTCDDWKTTHDGMFITTLPLSDAEKRFNYDNKSKMVNSSISVNVGDDKNNAKRKLPRLGERNDDTYRSWVLPSPRGHFFNRKWVSRYYNRTVLTPEQLAGCLKNTTIFVNGDSNAHIMFANISSRVGRHKVPNDIHDIHVPNDIHVQYNNHGFPFHHDLNVIGDFKSVVDTLDEIPSTGNYVVLLHLYAHYTFHHYSVMVHHIRAARAAMERCLLRNPRVKLVVRGPHHFDEKRKGWAPVNGGDIAAPLYTRLLAREFLGIYDHVYYLATFDMTVGVQNDFVHPPDFVNEAIVDEFLDYVCSTSKQ